MTDEPQIHVDEESGVRYLDPIVYEPVMRGGKRIGWKIPDHERERWDNPPKVDMPAAKLPEQPRPVARLVAELEAWIDLTPALERQLRAVYELEPLKTSRAAQSVVAGAESHRLTNPAGLLVTRLREIAAGSTPVELEPERDIVDDLRPDVQPSDDLAFYDTIELPEEATA